MVMVNKSSIIRDFIKYLAPYRFFIILCIFFQLSIAFLEIFQFHLLKTAIDIYVLKSNLLGLIKGVVVIYLFVLCLMFIFRLLQSYLTDYIAQNVMLDFRMKIFSHLQRMDLLFFDKNPIGKLMAVATNDVQLLKPVVTEGVINIFGDIVFFCGITGYLFYQNYQLTLITCVSVFVFGFYVLLINSKTREIMRESRSWFGKISSFLQENITGISLIKIFHQEKKQLDKLAHLNKSYTDLNRKSLYYSESLSLIQTMLSAAAMCFILWYGGREVLRGTLSLGASLVFVGSMGLFFITLERLIQANIALQTARPSLERIFELLDTKTEVDRPHGGIDLPEFKDKIQFKNVWFAYDNDDFVLENFNLEIQKGEQIGIVGHTGAGKTTISNLLTRFYEINKGEILIDGINIRNIQKRQLRSLIGIIPQEPYLFSGSIEDNIRLGNLKINSQQVQEAAIYADAHKFISQLPNGYKENVRELGSRLSTGQKQLISFARACLFNPKVIILDEATANVDAKTISMIEGALRKIKGNKTSIIIAHHLFTVRDADKIIVLHRGKIQELGTHKELMEKKGFYHKLYLLQEIEDSLTTITRSTTKLTEIVGYARLHYVQNAQLARRIGEKLNLTDKQLDELETAALIYDVGKIYLPVNILTKPGPLTNEEWAIMKTHVTFSKKVAEKIENFANIGNIVYYHHERWDGKGYLEGLKGEDIPLESRIIAVVDAYQAMLANRPYHKTFTLEEARKELLAGAGGQFDPKIVNIFIQIIDEENQK